MTLYDYLELTKNDFDTSDKDFDAIVTVCHIGKENDNYDKFCNELMKKVEVLSAGPFGIFVNWSMLIKSNMEKFRAFTKERWHWRFQDLEEDDFISQWLKELHLYLAGAVDDGFYDILAEFIETLTPSITKNYVVCIKDCYLRDTQVFMPEKDFDNEDEGEMASLIYDDNNWYEYTGSAFLGIYKWNETTLDGLRQYMIDLHGLHPDTLEIIPVE